MMCLYGLYSGQIKRYLLMRHLLIKGSICQHQFAVHELEYNKIRRLRAKSQTLSPDKHVVLFLRCKNYLVMY